MNWEACLNFDVFGVLFDLASILILSVVRGPTAYHNANGLNTKVNFCSFPLFVSK